MSYFMVDSLGFHPSFIHGLSHWKSKWDAFKGHACFYIPFPHFACRFWGECCPTLLRVGEWGCWCEWLYVSIIWLGRTLNTRYSCALIDGNCKLAWPDTSWWRIALHPYVSLQFPDLHRALLCPLSEGVTILGTRVSHLPCLSLLWCPDHLLARHHVRPSQ